MMLVLLIVGGAIFGDAESTTLTLSAPITAKLNHGFGATEYTTFGAIITAGGDISDATYNAINLETNDAQDVGYYYFATTHSGVTVDITATPMKLTVGNVTTYVPYSLALTKLLGTVGSTTTLTFAEGSVVGTTSIANKVVENFITASTSGPKWASYNLDVTFNGTANLAYGLPVGTYGATITVAVDAL